MKQQRKNKIFTLICSCLPGAAEMYMGFMKNGLSLMALFFLSLIIPSVLRISDVFILVWALLWFYGFFHARNLAACDEETFMELEDVYIWEEFMDGRQLRIPGRAAKKWFAYILIIFGVTSLWENLSSVSYCLLPMHLWEQLAPLLDKIPQIVIALLIIAIGLKMVRGKKEELDGIR